MPRSGPVGGGAGSGVLPFDGDNLQGDVAIMRYYSRTLFNDEVLVNYNTALGPADLGVAAVSGNVQLADPRPASVEEGSLEGRFNYLPVS